MEKTNKIKKLSKKSKKDNIFYDPSLKKRHAKAKVFKYFTIASLFFSSGGATVGASPCLSTVMDKGRGSDDSSDMT